MARRRRSSSASSKPLVDSGKPCVDGPHKTRRPTPYPGPRCKTDHLAVTRARRAKAKAAYVEKTYSITEEQYQAILKEQGGSCVGCPGRCKGIGPKRLSVDHDHECCPGAVSCGKCVRGLLCKVCNRDVLGHLRDDPEALRALADYLENPPARKVLG